MAGLFFFLVYALYLDYLGRPSLSESFFATAIFASSYLITSTFILRKKREKGK